MAARQCRHWRRAHRRRPAPAATLPTCPAQSRRWLADRRLCDALKVAKEIRASEIAVELKIALAYLAFHRGNIKESEKYFISSMKSVIGEKSEICRINVGILRGEEELTNKFSYYK